MSNLNSVFDTLRGWPHGSALEAGFEPQPGVTIAEGSIVKIDTRQHAAASVLKLINDALVTAPTLVAADAGKAYVVAGVGGAWSTFAIGDIVEWTGASWKKIISAVEAEVPTGTRAVVAGASAAGSFAGLENRVVQYTKETIALACEAAAYTHPVVGDIGKTVTGSVSGHTGKLVSATLTSPDRTWIVDPTTPADVFAVDDVLSIATGTGAGKVDSATPAGATWASTPPVDKDNIQISDADSIYAGMYFEFNGTSWNLALHQKLAPAIVKKLTSGTKASAVKDDAWVVIRGNDSWDSSFVNQVTCLKLQSGCVFKVAHTAADTLVPGTLVQANAGVLEAYSTKWPVGVVVYSNGVSGSGGIIAVASM